MNLAALPAFFAAHKTAVLGGGAAAVAGLALYRKRQAASGGTGSTAVGATNIPGTIPAGAVVSGDPQALGSYDSTAYDLYNSLSGQLEQAMQTGTSSAGAATAAPAPVASSLFAPSGTHQFVQGPNGMIAEVESDGSLFGLNRAQFVQAEQAAGGRNKITVTKVAQLPAQIFSTGNNLLAKNGGAAAKSS